MRGTETVLYYVLILDRLSEDSYVDPYCYHTELEALTRLSRLERDLEDDTRVYVIRKITLKGV